MQNPYLRFAISLGAAAILVTAIPATPGKAQDMGGEFQVTKPGGLGGALSGALDKAGNAVNSSPGATASQGTGVLTTPVTTHYRSIHTHTYHPGAYHPKTYHFTGPSVHPSNTVTTHPTSNNN